MRLARFALCVLVLGVRTARADDVEQVAAGAFEAWKAGDRESLRAHFAEAHVDGWLVAQRLCDASRTEAAVAWAEAAQGPDAADLARYVAGRRIDPGCEAARQAIAAAHAARDEAGARAALAALEELPPLEDPLRRAQVAAARAGLLQPLGRGEDALAAWLVAADIAEKTGWPAGATEALLARGHAAHALLDFETMLSSWSRYHDLAKRHGRPRDVARSDYFLGNAYAEVGQYERARDHMERAVDAYRASGNRYGAALGLCNLASGVLLRRGDYAAAQAALDGAGDLAAETTGPEPRATVIAATAGLHVAMGDHERALELFQRALDLYVPPDRYRFQRAQSIGGMGNACVQLRRFDAAEGHLSEALAIFNDLDAEQYVITARLNLAYLHEQKGEHAEAATLYGEALRTAREIHDPWLVANAQYNLSEALRALGRYEEARAMAEGAMQSAGEIGSVSVAVQAEDELAKLCLAQSDPAGALRVARKAVENLLRLVAGLGAEQGAQARARHADIFQTPVRAAAALDDAEQFGYFDEVWRAGGQLEALEGRDRIRNATIPEELRAAEAAARSNLVVAERRYRAAKTGEIRAEIAEQRAALAGAQSELEAVVARIQREEKRAAGLLYPTPRAPRELQGLLGDGDALVTYALLETDAFALVVTRSGSRIVALGGTKRLQQACERTAAALAERRADALAELDALSEDVVSALRLGKEIRRLLVAPDGAMYETPFAAIAPAYDVAYVPSGTVLALLERDRAGRGKGVLALGGPDYAGRQLIPLAASVEEAREVGDVQLLGKEANETLFRAALGREGRWRAVHLACHGAIDAGRPMRSRLEVTAVAPDDGSLTALEVYGMQVPADLVVLSACESGRGRVYQGEGLVGFTRAFMFAGAPRVIVSLWKVDDAATRELMRKFYELWNPKDGSAALATATALKRAQAHVASQEQWKHPYYWAAWQLWGLPD